MEYRIAFLLALLVLTCSAVAQDNRAKTFPLNERLPVQGVLYCTTLEAAKEAADGYAADEHQGAVVMFTYNKQGICHRGDGHALYEAQVYETSDKTWRVFRFNVPNGKIYYEITDWKIQLPKGQVNM